MVKRSLLMALTLSLLAACSTRKSKIVNPSLLQIQVITVDPSRDNIVRTVHGAIIQIPKDGLQSNGNAPVKLEIKEAYSIVDMVRGGMLTQSDGKPLSSGGMIYINALDESDVRIVKPISVAIPSRSLDEDMELYKGEIKSDGSINWTDPQPLPENPQMKALAAGRAIFLNNCASCHAIDRKVNGPELAHILKRNAWMLHQQGWEGDTIGQYNLLYDFTLDSRRVLKRGSEYFNCLFHQYNETPMNTFPNLTDKDLDNLYAYIQNESEVRNLPVNDNGILKCMDSCRLYNKTKSNLQEIKERLEKDSSDMVDLTYHFTELPPLAPDTFPAIATLPAPPPLDKVEPSDNKSLYYQFKIDVFGWYNVDQLLGKSGMEESKLSVHVNGAEENRFNIFLVIPSIRLFVEGGKLNEGNNTFGFFLTNGTIPLPQNNKAYILAMGESDGNILFAMQAFQTSTNQQLSIELKQVDKDYFNAEIRSLDFSNVAIQANDTKTGKELREVIKKLEKAEELKPKNCDCSCLHTSQTKPVAVAVPGAEGEDVRNK